MDRGYTESLIGGHEGRIPHLYLDTEGIVTAGIGKALFHATDACAMFHRDVTADFARVLRMEPGHGADFYNYPGAPQLTDAQIDAQFCVDLDIATASALRLLPNFSSLPDPVQAVLVDLEFNLGNGGLAKFHDALGSLGRGDLRGFADGLRNSIWYHQTGQRAVRNVQIILQAA